MKNLRIILLIITLLITGGLGLKLFKKPIVASSLEETESVATSVVIEIAEPAEVTVPVEVTTIAETTSPVEVIESAEALLEAEYPNTKTNERTQEYLVNFFKMSYKDVIKTYGTDYELVYYEGLEGIYYPSQEMSILFYDVLYEGDKFIIPEESMVSYLIIGQGSLMGIEIGTLPLDLMKRIGGPTACVQEYMVMDEFIMDYYTDTFVIEVRSSSSDSEILRLHVGDLGEPLASGDDLIQKLPKEVGITLGDSKETVENIMGVPDRQIMLTGDDLDVGEWFVIYDERWIYGEDTVCFDESGHIVAWLNYQSGLRIK